MNKIISVTAALGCWVAGFYEYSAGETNLAVVLLLASWLWVGVVISGFYLGDK